MNDFPASYLSDESGPLRYIVGPPNKKKTLNKVKLVVFRFMRIKE